MDAPHQPSCLLKMIGVSVASKLAPEVAVVQNVNWQIDEGDFWVVAGLSGSGKTELLLAAAGIQRPAQGRLFLFGEPTDQLNEYQWIQLRRRIGFVFEDGGRLFHRLTVRENVALPLCYHQNLSVSAAQRPVEILLEWLHLTAFAHSTPAGLARGHRQRVALARAMVLQPDLLFLDNPVAGLDPDQVHAWQQWLVQLSHGAPQLNLNPTTLVVSSDELRPWKKSGRRYALLKDRRWQTLSENPRETG